MSKSNLSGLPKTVASLIKDLSPRNKDIISRRFGLKNGKKETLESIGGGYGITRERVRQIEEFSLAQLAKVVDSNTEVKKYIQMAKDIVSSHSGVFRERDLFADFSGNDQDSSANAALVLFLSLDREVVRFNESDHFHSFWASNNKLLDSFKTTSASLVSLLNKSGKTASEDDFYSMARESGATGFDGSSFSKDHLNTFLTVSKDAGKNIFNEIGLASWSEIKPKGVRDKAYLVLKKESSAKHFGDIAKLINTYKFSGKKANVQTVHNELIKDNRFVLIGRGMYALSEWGYKPGTVKDVLVDLLRSSSKPLAKSALLTKVMNARMVKENTILLNLQDSKVFSKNEDGTYTLRKA